MFLLFCFLYNLFPQRFCQASQIHGKPISVQVNVEVKERVWDSTRFPQKVVSFIESLPSVLSREYFRLISLCALVAVHTEVCSIPTLFSPACCKPLPHYGQEKFCILLSLMSVEVKEETLGNNYIFISTDFPDISEFLILRAEFFFLLHSRQQFQKGKKCPL